MILLISADDKVSTALTEDLSKEGFKIEVLKEFSDTFLEENKGNSYQLVLLDFQYSKHDVLEICQKLKHNPAFKLIPLVCLLEKNRFTDQLLAFEMGVDDFILMPYSTLEIQLKLRSIERLIDLQNQLRQKDTQLENLRNIQRVMVTLNHYINNAMTPLYFSVQMLENHHNDEDCHRMQDIAKETVEFISKVLQSLHKIVQSEKIKVVKEGVYKDLMFDIENELNKLIEKTPK